MLVVSGSHTNALACLLLQYIISANIGAIFGANLGAIFGAIVGAAADGNAVCTVLDA